jgi:acyl carrier protein
LGSTRRDADGAHLTTQLPAHMIPSAFVILKALPLNTSGKVDQTKLPAPIASVTDECRLGVAPRTRDEAALCGMWAEVLGVEHVGIHDNFFDFGGHSLLAIKLAAQIQKQLDVELRLSDVFSAPTVATLATRLTRGSPPLPIVPANSDEPAMSFAQRGLWFLDQLEVGLVAYNMPSAWRLSGPLDIDALRRALQTVIDRHPPLRTVFQLENGTPTPRSAPSPTLSLAVTDLSAATDSAVEQSIIHLAREEAHRPFDLSRDLLLRAGLLRLSAQSHILLLTLHHVAADGWSLRLLLNELGELYPAFSAGNVSRLPALSFSYADYVHRQDTTLNGEQREPLVGYWRRQLDQFIPSAIPTDS